MEFSKKEKKAARAIFEKSVQQEYAACLQKALDITAKWSGEKPEDNREAYSALFTLVKECDKQIARRYDGISGSNYPFLVAELLADGLATKDDLADFSPENRAMLMRWAHLE